MSTLIERYTYDVVRRLPEKDRKEVRRELTANIYDMLSEQPDDEEVAEVLNSLGSPRDLADKYRHRPNYLISPAVYYDYLHAIKWVIPLAGGIMLFIGLILGAFESLGEGMVEAQLFVGRMISRGLSYGASGAFAALFWTTVGFAIADRADASKRHDGKAWTIDKLPEKIEEDKNRIPLSDSIVSLVVIVVFMAAALLLLTMDTHFKFGSEYEFYGVREIFSPSLVALGIPFIVIGCICGVTEYIVKIAVRRWTPLVCVVVLASNVIGVALLLVLVLQPEILSQDFIAFAEGQTWWKVIPLNFGPFELVTNFVQLVWVFAVAMAIIGILVESATTIYKTIRAGGSLH